MKKLWREILHGLDHLFHTNTGRVVTFWLDDVLYVGFKCDGCGEINHAHATDRIKIDWQSPMPSLARPRFPVKVISEEPVK